MSTIYDDSVFQIQSQDKTNSKFGTGFVFYVDEKGSYLATCMHVLEQVKNPLINNQLAKVISNGADKNIDLAVLYLEGTFLKALKIQALDCKDSDVKLVGYSKFTSKQDQVKEREATLLGDKVKLKNKENNNTHYAWQIVAKDNFEIESGNSGGPLLCNVTQKVMAVMSHNVRGGEGGFAIDIEHLKDIWQEIPKELFDVKENPYKGLSSFSFDDREKYFGREEEQESIAKTLEKEETRLFTLLGASGSGKSSLLFAGILPLIQKEGIQILSFRPSEEPFRKLANIFIPTLYPDPTDRSEQKDKLPEKLKSADVKLNSLCETFFEITNVKTLYIIVDQFEELFSLTKEKAVKQLFLDQLLTLVNSKLNVKLIIAMRSDFITHFSFYEAFSKAYDDYPTKTLTLMLEPNLEKAIRLPAENLDIGFEEGLIARMLNEVSDEDGQLPLLEFTLHILWEKIENGVISHKAYDDIGGVAKAISQYADEVYVTYEKSQQENIQRIFLKLVNPGRGAEDTRRVATFDDFSLSDHQLIRLLADHKLIVTKDTEIEVIHEALIREWTRLKDWVNEFREFLEWEKQIREDYRVYEKNGDLLRDSKLLNASKFLENFDKQISVRVQKFIAESIDKDRKEKRKKIVVFSVIGLVLIGLTLFAFIKWNDAEVKTGLLKVESQKTTKQLEETEHNLGLVFAEKATQFERDKEYTKAHYFAYQALSKLSNDKSDTILTSTVMRNIIENSDIPLTSFLMDINSSVSSVNFSPDGKRIVSGSGDSIIRVWDSVTGKEIQLLKGHTQRVTSVSFSPNNKTIVSSSHDGTIRIWDIERGEEIKLIEKDVWGGAISYVKSVNFSPDGTKIVLGSSDGMIQIWDIKGGKELEFKIQATRKSLMISPFISFQTAITSVSFSPNGKTIVSGSHDGRIQIWDAKTGKKIQVFNTHTNAVIAVEFSPDGTKVVSTSDNKIVIWDTMTGKGIHGFEGHKGIVMSVSFSPDGRKIVSGSRDNTIRIWDAETFSEFELYFMTFSGEELQLFNGHTLTVNSVKFSPDGRKIVSGSDDGTIRIWDIVIGKKLKFFNEGTLTVNSLNFSSDGKMIVLDSDNKTIKLSNLDNSKFIKNKIKLLEQQLQAELDGINLKPKSIPFKKPIYSKYNPHHWLKEANEGNTTAMYELGIVYDRENENKNALKWYKKASDGGHSGAKERLEMLKKWMEKNREEQ